MNIRYFQIAATFAAACVLTSSHASAQLTLLVDRDTNGVSIVNETDTAVLIDEYRIDSAAGSLDNSNARWTSLDDLTFGVWREVDNASSNLLAELRQSGATNVTETGGSEPSISIGTPFAPVAAEFGTELEDLQFSYSGPAGIANGTVSYVGTKDFNTLVLEVDAASGAVSITNQSAFDVDVVNYEINSPAGSLDTGWSGIGGDWDPIGSPSANLLAELDFGPAGNFGLSLNAGQSVSIGNAYTAGAAADEELSFSFGLVGDEQNRMGGVAFGGGNDPIAGDYDASGAVGQGDLDLVLLNWGATAPPVPDGWINQQPSGLIGQGDLDGVLLNWGNSAVAGAAVGAVPEPSSLVLLLGSLALMGGRRNR